MQSYIEFCLMLIAHTWSSKEYIAELRLQLTVLDILLFSFSKKFRYFGDYNYYDCDLSKIRR